MRRIDSMSRFAEPEEVKPVASCGCCGADLYEGDRVFKFDGYILCEEDCVIGVLGIGAETL